MPRFVKGSQEAKDFMAKVRNAKKDPNYQKKLPSPNKGIRKRNKETKVDLPLMNKQEIAVPEYFANKNVSKTGKVSYRLVNPLTKTRNLSKRSGETSIKLIRKPVEHMVLMEHSNQPIPLALFSKKDRETINSHFKVVEDLKNKPISEVPFSAPFQNKERGRPENLQRNIEINKERKVQKKTEPTPNIIMNIEEPSQTKQKRQYNKHTSEEERKEAIKKQKAESAKRIREAKKGDGIGGKLSVSHLKNLLNASYNKSIDNLDGFNQDKQLSTKTTKVYHNPTTGQVVVAHKGTQGLTDWLNNGVYAYGGEKAYKLTPRYREAKKVQEEAEKKYGANNISTIGHSQGGLQAELLGGKSKEIITLNKATRPLSNHKNDNQYDIRTTGDLVSMNNPFQKKNNKEVVIKSQTSNPLKEHSIDVLDQLDENKEIGEGLNFKGKNNISHNNIMPKFVKGSKEAKEYMAKLRNMRGKGIPDERFFKVKPRHSGSDGADANHKSSLGSGLYAGGSPPSSGGSVGSIIDDGISQARHFLGVGIPPHSRNYGTPPMMGFGVHHHHHYHIGGEGMWDWLDPKKNGVEKAFDPNQNGVAKAFTQDLPKALEPVKDVAVRAGDKIKDTAEKTFTPQLGKDITSGLIHQALPSVIGSLAGSATTLATGNPYAGFAVGQTFGKYAGKKAGDALGNATGYGLKKGSKEAKEHMAKLRAMRRH